MIFGKRTTVLHVRMNDFVVVHRGELLFRFQISRRDDGTTSLDIFLAMIDEDTGERLPIDTPEFVPLEVGGTHEFDYEGMDDGKPLNGTGSITLASVDGNDVCVHVKLPKGWGAEPEKLHPLDDGA